MTPYPLTSPLPAQHSSAAVRPISAATNCHPVPPPARVGRTHTAGSVLAAPPASRAPAPRGVKPEVVNESPRRRGELGL